MQIYVRPMYLSDLDQIMEIEPVAFGVHHWSRQSFINELNNTIGHYITATDQDNHELVLGYSGFWLIGDEAHITTLAVNPDHRRLHIGERLLIHDIIEAERVGAARLTLEVRISNEGAQNLYYKYGFENLGKLKRYYQDNSEDALVLWLNNIRDPKFKVIFKERVRQFGSTCDWPETPLLKEKDSEPAEPSLGERR